MLRTSALLNNSSTEEAKWDIVSMNNENDQAKTHMKKWQLNKGCRIPQQFQLLHRHVSLKHLVHFGRQL